MTLDIQQRRISALFLAAFFASVCFDPQKAEKCDAFVRKPYFLRPWGAQVPDHTHVIRIDQLFPGTASGAGIRDERQ